MKTELAEELTRLEEENRETLSRVRKVLTVALGEFWFDRYPIAEITDYGIGIAEPGYSSDGPVWILGDWNPKRFRPKEGEPEITNWENFPVRLNEIFERIGVFTGWLDEWSRCDDCRRIFRIEPNSYSWRKFGLVTKAGSVLCADCVTFEDIEDDYVNNSDMALTFDIDLAAEGFEPFNGRYQNGFFPGQDDNPREILERALREFEEGIFTIDSTGQFDVDFSLWVRNPLEEEETEEPEEGDD